MPAVNIALRIRRPRIFYGWWLVVMTAARGSITVGSYFANSVLLVPMQQDLGWSRSLLIGVLTIKSIVSGVLGPLVGPIGDHRWLPRLVLPAGTLILGASMLVVKWVETPAQFYLLHGVAGALGTALAGNAILDAIVVKWFVRKRAQALMWTNVGPATGPLLFPPIVTAMLATLGWRDTWFWLGVFTILVLAPLSVFVYTRPEERGTWPDGIPPEATASGPGDATARGRARPDAPALNEVSLTRAQALRTPTFWLLAIGGSFGFFGVQGYQVHWIPYLRESGFSAGTAATAVLVYGVFTVSARFFWGFWSSRYATRLVLTAQGVAAGSVVVLFLNVHTTSLLFVWAVAQGLTLAGYFQLQALITTNYFGREHIGAIRGMMFPISTVASASSPLLLGVFRDATGDYVVSFAVVAVLWFAAAAVMLITPRPRVRG